MQQLPTDPNLLHHAYVIEGDTVQTVPFIFDFLKKVFGISHGYPDLYTFKVEDFGVDHTADIIRANLRKPIGGGRTFIVAEFSSISHQAQNSLLKLLEEPRGQTHIFLLTNSSAVFLPTVLSRVHVVSGPAQKDSKVRMTTDKKNDAFDPIETAQNFLKNDAPKRLIQVKEILELKTDEEIGDADIERFFMEIEKTVHHHIVELGADKPQTKKSSLETLVKIGDYLRDSSSSVKLLLEYAALMLPVVK
jgi:hypothetical protein